MAGANDELMKVKYETAMGEVEMDKNTVRNYIAKNAKVTDEEIVMFMQLCKAQKLNPFVNGEVHLIKYNQNSPAQLVVGYDAYKRRAEENPNHLYMESGIVVMRGDEIVVKAGACLYPNEKLVGGWCRVHKIRNGKEVTDYKEVTLAEYHQHNKMWNEKPCTMIEKVAISQCLREAYPHDYEGLYTQEEMPEGKEVADFEEAKPSEKERVAASGVQSEKKSNKQDVEIVDAEFVEIDKGEEKVTQKDRQMLFRMAHDVFGKERGNDIVKDILNKYGYKSTQDLNNNEYMVVKAKLNELIDELNAGDEMESESLQQMAM